MNGLFFAMIGVALATILSGIGSAKGVGGAAQTAMGVLSEDSSKFGKMLVLTLLPGTQGLYGFIVGFLIMTKTVMAGADVSTEAGWLFLAASLPIAVGGLVSALAQGKAAVSAIALTAKSDANFSKGMVSVTLVEIYALLAFIVSLLSVLQING